MSGTNPSRIADIAQQIRDAVQPITAADILRSDASDALQAASQAATGLREHILGALATLSIRGKWQASEINLAAARVAGTISNQAAGSLATFISECKRAMSPNVRAHVAHLTRLRDDVWTAEKANKDGPQPCAKAFRRGYHMLLAMFSLCEDGTLLRTAGDVIAWAVENDPDLDYAKVSKRLDAIRKTLAGFAGDFPVEGFVLIDEFLGNITKDVLKQARDAKVRADAAKVASHPLASVPPVVAARVAAAVEVAPEPVAGAFDPITMLDEALGLAA